MPSAGIGFFPAYSDVYIVICNGGGFTWAQVDVKVAWVKERGLGLGVLKSDGYFTDVV